MAKKKRRLARRPRPNADGAAKKTTAGASADPKDGSEGEEGDAPDDGDAPEDRQSEEPVSSAEDDDASDSAANSPEADVDRDGIDDSASPVASEPADNAELADNAEPADDSEPPVSAEMDVIRSVGLEGEEDPWPEDSNESSGFSEELDDEGLGLSGEGVEESADLGPTLIGEGLEADESEVEDTEHFLRGLVEAILFSSDKPQTAREVARAARIDKGRCQELIEILIEDTKDRGMRLVEVSEGYAFRTNPAYSAYVREFLAQRPVRLSRAQLETLAIVAYRQPLTRPEVDDIRGVDSGAVLKTLLDRELVRILGKKDEPGRPMIYGTTPAFLDLFSLKSLRDLPTLREFTELSEDSRAKFELEIGEPAPEGPISFPEEDSTSEDSDSEGDSSSDGALNEGDPVEGSAPELEDANSHADDSDASPDEEEEEDSEGADEPPEEDGLDEEADHDALPAPPISAADEEEFPDDEDDDDEDEDDDDDEDEDDED